MEEKNPGSVNGVDQKVSHPTEENKKNARKSFIQNSKNFENGFKTFYKKSFDSKEDLPNFFEMAKILKDSLHKEDLRYISIRKSYSQDNTILIRLHTKIRRKWDVIKDAIKDFLVDEGIVKYQTKKVHMIAHGVSKDINEEFIKELENVIYDDTNCRISFHQRSFFHNGVEKKRNHLFFEVEPNQVKKLVNKKFRHICFNFVLQKYKRMYYQCSFCLATDHANKKCPTRKRVCFRCLSTEHLAKDCNRRTVGLKCKHCNGQHPSNDINNCSKLKEIKINKQNQLKVQVKERKRKELNKKKKKKRNKAIKEQKKIQQERAKDGKKNIQAPWTNGNPFHNKEGKIRENSKTNIVNETQKESSESQHSPAYAKNVPQMTASPYDWNYVVNSLHQTMYALNQYMEMFKMSQQAPHQMMPMMHGPWMNYPNTYYGQF